MAPGVARFHRRGGGNAFLAAMLPPKAIRGGQWHYYFERIGAWLHQEHHCGQPIRAPARLVALIAALARVAPAASVTVECQPTGGVGMSEQSQGPGWWQASDGKWYSPEQVPFATAGPAVGPDQPETTPPIWRRRWFLITAVVVGLLIVIGALSPSKGEDKIETESSNSAPEEDTHV